ncbi:MAG: glycosyltransferase [Planctomycetota bacterium]
MAQPGNDPTCAGSNDVIEQGSSRLRGNLKAWSAWEPELAAEVEASGVVLGDGLDATTGGGWGMVDAEGVWAGLRAHLLEGRAIALLGVGDDAGSAELLERLAWDCPELDEGRFGRCGFVYVWAGSWDAVRGLMARRDWSGVRPGVGMAAGSVVAGGAGPLDGGRFRWFVGSEAGERFERMLRDDPAMSPPMVSVDLREGMTGFREQQERATLVAGYRSAVAGYRAWHAGLAERVDRYYAGRDRQHFVNALAHGRGRAKHLRRRPRILLYTSRFTTVLQHATSDAEAAFAELGWDTHTLIEPSPAHRVSAVTCRAVLDRFRPDAVFMIDHLRRDYQGLFPDQLPVLTWVQDDLPTLASPSAGASIGLRDFVLTCSSLYTQQFGYPARQCVYLHKLTRDPDVSDASRAKPSAAPVDDLVFVSHGSARPAEVLGRLLDERRNAGLPVSVGHRNTGEALIAEYERGQWVATLPELQQRVAHELGQDDPAWSLELFNRLNNTLYRQQALAWARDYATDHGRSLGLYGNGWEHHPEFRDHARGPVAYGSDLTQLTRNAAVNLQLLPFSCLHQRLLDGLAAGGFFLVRGHPTDDAWWSMCRLIAEKVPPQTQTWDEARDSLSGDDWAELAGYRDALQQAEGGQDTLGPYLPAVHAFTDENAEVHAYRQLPPAYDQITFRDRDQLAHRLDHFLANPEQRRLLAEQQRGHVLSTKSYKSGLKRVLREIRERLIDEAQMPAVHVTHTDVERLVAGRAKPPTQRGAA